MSMSTTGWIQGRILQPEDVYDGMVVWTEMYNHIGDDSPPADVRILRLKFDGGWTLANPDSGIYWSKFVQDMDEQVAVDSVSEGCRYLFEAISTVEIASNKHLRA